MPKVPEKRRKTEQDIINSTENPVLGFQKNNRDKSYTIRLTDKEFNSILSASQSLGMPMATFIRVEALKASKSLETTS